MPETLVGINGFGRIGRIVFRNAYVLSYPHYGFSFPICRGAQADILLTASSTVM